MGVGAIMGMAVIYWFSEEDTKTLYKIVSDTNLEIAGRSGSLPFEEADLTGDFIHLVYKHQALDKVYKYFTIRGISVKLLKLNQKMLENFGYTLKVEVNPGGSNSYPHLYHSSGKLVEIPLGCIEEILDV